MSEGTSSTIDHWTPHPQYPFVGGPCDGQQIRVRLYRNERGWVPPPVWNLAMTPDLIQVPNERVARRLAYRFVPAAGKMNQGHYEFIE